jgi:hypothetical protein
VIQGAKCESAPDVAGDATSTAIASVREVLRKGRFIRHDLLLRGITRERLIRR